MEEKDMLVDEESLIPKGLLDVSWEEAQKVSSGERGELANTKSMSYGTPCFITLLPVENSNIVGDRYQNGYGQGIDASVAPQQLNYSGLMTNDLYAQHQRNPRAQPHRYVQDVECPWWNQIKVSQSCLPFNSGSDVRTSKSRNNNTAMNDRMYVPVQPCIPSRWPYEYQQRIYNTNMIGGVGRDVPFSKTPGSKAALSNVTSKVEKESQTDLSYSIWGNVEKGVECKNEDESWMSSEENPLSEECYKTSNSAGMLPSQSFYFSISSRDRIENIIEQDTFRNAAFYGCLQIEQLLSNFTSKTQCGLDLTELNTLKLNLSKPRNQIKGNTVGQEMTSAFIQICNSWIILDNIKQQKSHMKLYFDALHDNIISWEKLSKTLIQNIIIAAQNILIEESSVEAPVIKILKNNLNKTKNSESELFIGLPKKRSGEGDVDCLNYNWRSGQAGIKECDQNEITECAMCQLIPETHKSHNESTFACDNFMKSLKKNQDKSSSKITITQKYGNSKSNRNNSPRRKYFNTTQNYSRENILRNDLVDKMYTDSQNKSKISRLNQNNSHVNSEFLNLNSITACQKLLDENRNINYQIFDKLNSNDMERQCEAENEKCQINKATSSVNHEKESDTEIDNSSDKTKAKRYSQQCKKKTSSGKVKQAENSERNGNREMSSSRKLKLYEILNHFQTMGFEEIVSEKIDENEATKIKKTLIEPISRVAQSLVRNVYRSSDEIVGMLLSLFYQAKFDNKGNILLLTTANNMEIKLMNTVYMEIRAS